MESSTTTKIVKPHPFIKWAGGKTQLLPELLKRIPKSWDREKDLYVEPFVGGGALFWELQPKHAVLNDKNTELVRVYRVLKAGGVEFQAMGRALLELQQRYRVDPSGTYAAIREWVPDGPAGAVARTLFLNKTGFNGLYRVNQSGKFNVPWGKNSKVTILDEENLRACSEFLQSIQVGIACKDFVDISVPPGALVYFDPPYIPVSKTSNFTTYTAGGFNYYDQLRLAIHAAYLKKCGCHVMLTQAADKSLIDQYRRLGFTCDRVKARRNINSNADKRGAVGEYIIY